MCWLGGGVGVGVSSAEKAAQEGDQLGSVHVGLDDGAQIGLPLVRDSSRDDELVQPLDPFGERVVLRLCVIVYVIMCDVLVVW